MKVVAYSVKSFEKEYLVKANYKKHDITFITSRLDERTVRFAKGKSAVLVFVNDNVNSGILKNLEELGVKLIITRSAGMDHINQSAAKDCGIKVLNAPAYSPEAVAEMGVALAFSLSRQIIQANSNSSRFNFTNEGLMGFNFYGKTVGIIGLGNTGLAAARIFDGCGCKVIGHDIIFPTGHNIVEPTSLDDLLAQSDVISLHVPLTDDTRHMICKKSIDKMKPAVMLINTARGALLNTTDVLTAIDTGQIGYLGMDVYEFEKDLFFENHQGDVQKDGLLQKFFNRNNVIVTPHQGYLTREAVTAIAKQTIKHLDNFIIT